MHLLPEAFGEPDAVPVAPVREIAVFSVDDKDEPHVHYFGSTELKQALALTEELRKEGRRHVTISTALVESVTKPGVADVLPGYDWKKRRV